MGIYFAGGEGLFEWVYETMFGMLTEAAERIRDALARCWQEALGRDGFRLAEAVPFYLREMEINRRVDVVRNKTILDRHLVPFFGELPLREVTREQGCAYIEHGG